MVYSRSKDLENICLKHGDAVVFYTKKGVHIYNVKSNCLKEEHKFDNNIFESLGISNAEKYSMASNIYGYQTRRGIFPQCHEHDYKALTNFAKHLMKLCETKFQYNLEY